MKGFIGAIVSAVCFGGSFALVLGLLVAGCTPDAPIAEDKASVERITVEPLLYRIKDSDAICYVGFTGGGNTIGISCVPRPPALIIKAP